MSSEPNDTRRDEDALVAALRGETDAISVVRDRLATIVMMLSADGGTRLERATRDLEIASAALATVSGVREQRSLELGVVGSPGSALEAGCSDLVRPAVSEQLAAQRMVLDEIEGFRSAVTELVARAERDLGRHRRALDGARAGQVTYKDPRRESGSAGAFVAFSA